MIVVGLGVQGRKRLRVAGTDAVATVDPVAEADFKRVEDVGLLDYDAALVCVPDPEKLDVLSYLLREGKHVLVEKPLLAEKDELTRLHELAQAGRATCYTAYNHRFEPHIVRMRDLVRSGRLGTIYLARIFYGNGTARDVRDSPWRDRGDGVLADLGSHLLDTARFWFGAPRAGYHISGAYRFENRAFDHLVFRAEGPPVHELEATLCSWRNHFAADVYAEKGSAHIASLCKWGPTAFRVRWRVLPSGRPPEETVTLVQPDPTWDLEYRHFKRLCSEGRVGISETDFWLSQVIRGLSREAFDWDASQGG